VNQLASDGYDFVTVDELLGVPAYQAGSGVGLVTLPGLSP
jgi:hypothetical protein